jgi:anti-anti-sigma factor
LSTTGSRSKSKATHTGRPHGGTGNGRGPTMEIVADGHTLVLSGDFDVRSTMDVRSAIHEAMYVENGFDQDVVLDLTNVHTIDLTAARVLAYATLEASRAGHHLRLRGCGPAVRRMLHLTRLARFVEVDRAAASA